MADPVTQVEPAAPQPAVEPAPQATPEPVAPAPDATVAPDAAEPKPDRTFTQAELDDIIEKRLAKERRKRSDLENRLRITEELHLRGKAPDPQHEPQQPKAGGEPTREQYQDYESFLEARAEWRADQRVEKRLSERDQKQQEERQKETAAKQAAEFQKRMKESSKGMEDFEDVMAEAVRDPSQPVARLLAEPLDAAENPAAILYHLAKNQDEAERIAALPMARQAREIWLLDAKIKSQPQARPSRAPAPLEPVGGKAAVASEEITGNETPEEFLRKRNAQLRKKRGG